MQSLAIRAVAACLALLPCAAAVSAQELKTYKKQGTYDDVKFELGDAIVARGLVIDHKGDIGSMLERTGADVGSSRKIYVNAEFFMFCSAKLSRNMMEADPLNAGNCPYTIFLYEAADKPGEIVVGYRKPVLIGNEESRKALAAVDALLDGIAKDALK